MIWLIIGAIVGIFYGIFLVLLIFQKNHILTGKDEKEDFYAQKEREKRV